MVPPVVEKYMSIETRFIASTQITPNVRAVTCFFVVSLQEGNTPQGSSHGVKISEPQKKTSFFRCSLLWGQRPTILAASWLDINGLCLLLALPPPPFSHPWPVHTNHDTPISGGLSLLSSSSLKEKSYLQGSDHLTDEGHNQEHIFRCSISHR